MFKKVSSILLCTLIFNGCASLTFEPINMDIVKNMPDQNGFIQLKNSIYNRYHGYYYIPLSKTRLKVFYLAPSEHYLSNIVYPRKNMLLLSDDLLFLSAAKVALANGAKDFTIVKRDANIKFWCRYANNSNKTRINKDTCRLTSLNMYMIIDLQSQSVENSYPYNSEFIINSIRSKHELYFENSNILFFNPQNL